MTKQDHQNRDESLWLLAAQIVAQKGVEKKPVLGDWQARGSD